MQVLEVSKTTEMFQKCNDLIRTDQYLTWVIFQTLLTEATPAAPWLPKLAT